MWKHSNAYVRIKRSNTPVVRIKAELEGMEGGEIYIYIYREGGEREMVDKERG